MNDPRILVFLCTLGMCAGCASTRYISQWRGHEITIDGYPSEWNDYIEYPAHIIPNMGIGALCDSDHVYLCLTADDRAVASKMLGAGFSITFQNPEQKGALFGVYFPLGMKQAGPGLQKHDPEAAAARLEASLQMLALLGPGKNDTAYMPVGKAESLGVEVRVKARAMDECTYELKAPLRKNGSPAYAIDAARDSSVIVTLETGEPRKPEARPSRGGRGGPPGGAPEGPDGGEGGAPPGRGPGGGPPSGGGPGFGGGGHGPQPGSREPIKTTFTLLLSRSPVAGK